jgi:hypothetical protein
MPGFRHLPRHAPDSEQKRFWKVTCCGHLRTEYGDLCGATDARSKLPE